jgi:flavin-dependent dehydrogenase
VTKDKIHYQVLIIGGGPAGIATSLTLSARGVSNCIVEAQLEPQPKPGESIPPNAKPLLQKMGLLELVEHPKHTVYYGNKSCWGSGLLEEKEFIKGIYGHGFLLNRLYFERQLRERAEKFGGKCWIGYKMIKLDSSNDGIEIQIGNGETTEVLHGEFIVDATGRKASVCNKLNVKKQELDKQFALTFHAKLEKEIPQQITVEATRNGWWYAAPNDASSLVLMFFTNKEIIPEKSEIASFLMNEFDSSNHISKMTTLNAGDLDETKIMPTGTNRLKQPYGDNWLAVGDAAYSYDPISSYGITSALSSGFYGGHAIASKLDGENEAMMTYHYLMEKSFETYVERRTIHYSTETRWKEAKFWKMNNADLEFQAK